MRLLLVVAALWLIGLNIALTRSLQRQKEAVTTVTRLSHSLRTQEDYNSTLVQQLTQEKTACQDTTAIQAWQGLCDWLDENDLLNAFCFDVPPRTISS